MSAPVLFVFGSSGQLARALIERGEAGAARVTALGRNEADLTDPEALRKAVAAAPTQAVVVNAAAYTAVDQAESEPELAEAVNAIAPGVIAEACARRVSPLIHVSTDYVYDGEKPAPYVEDDPVNPLGVYGRTKLAGERAVIKAGGRAIITRTSWVYSPFGKNFVKTMVRVGGERDQLRIVDDQRGAPTSAHDLADGIIAAARALGAGRGAFGVFHLTGGGEASWADFAEAIFDIQEPLWGRRPSVERISTAQYPTPAKRPANSRLSNDKFAAAFGYRAPDWRESLKAVMERLNAAG